MTPASNPHVAFEKAAARGIHRNVIAILSKRADLQERDVLDFACGDGRTTHLLRQLGARVTPCDLFPEHYKLEDKPLSIDIRDASALPTASADLIVLQEVIEHLPDQLGALREMARTLRPGGEVFLTTPNRSSLAAKLSFMLFESENIKLTPWGAHNSIWGADVGAHGRQYYGHLWLIGMQQLRALALLAGFAEMQVQRTEISRTSLLLLPLVYPILVLITIRATLRALGKTSDTVARREIVEQCKLNINPRNLINKFLVVVLKKAN